VLVGLFEDAEGFEVGDDGLAGVEAVEARYLAGAFSLILASSVRIEIIGRPWRWPTA
jgi:hypothetical protein